MDVKAVPVRKACTQMLKGAIRQQRYRLKQKYFDPFPLNLATKTSPVRSMTDDQWNELAESWKDPQKWYIYSWRQILFCRCQPPLLLFLVLQY